MHLLLGTQVLILIIFWLYTLAYHFFLLVLSKWGQAICYYTMKWLVKLIIILCGDIHKSNMETESIWL